MSTSEGKARRRAIVGASRIFLGSRRIVTRNGHSLVEIIVVVLMIGILACVAVPRLQSGAVYRARADAFARRMMTDLRRTRSHAILNAAENPDGFALVMNGPPVEYRGYEIVDLSDSIVVASHEVPSSVTCAGGARFEFGPLGNLKDGGDTQLQVSAEGRTFTITIVPATGIVALGGGS